MSKDRTEYLHKWYLGRKNWYKESHLKKTYGLTLEDFIKILENQNSLCGICKKDLTKLSPKSVHIDHCHNSTDLKIRGILCNKCNMALGLLNDDVNLFNACRKYLEK